VSLVFTTMGNEQSVPVPRRPANKLSKPKTNSRTPVILSRRNSVVTEVGSSKPQYSSLSVDVLVVGEPGRKRDESTSRKRMSIFRSKSSQPKIASQLEISSGVNIEYLNESPVRSPAPNADSWSRNSSVVELKQQQQQHYNAPVQRRVL
jgi:hypothetical protein